MSKIPGSEQTIELLVNCKTYPAVSKKYVETVCTGGVQASGEFVRLYPVPFRLLDSEERYERWEIIRVRVYRDTKDTRPESWHLMPGTPIERVKTLKTAKKRWEWMRETIHSSSQEMESKGVTNGCVQIEPIELYWKADPKEWTAVQRQVIEQRDLYASEEQMSVIAERVPYEFRLKYREIGNPTEFDNKVLSWSYYQGFLRERNRVGSDKEAMETIANKIRKSIFDPDRCVFAILGTHSRFGHWMISGLYYVPRKVVGKRPTEVKDLF